MSIEREVSTSMDWHLQIIETALDAGDVGAARQHLRTIRRSLVCNVAERRQQVPVGGVALTGQEVRTLHLLPDGSLSQKDIAHELGVTRNTLKTHLKSLYRKLGAHCRAEAIDTAREIGLLGRPLTLIAPSGPVDRVHVA